MKTMNKLITICALSLPLLGGCNKEDNDTQKQIAALQEQLAQQQKAEAERTAKENELQQQQREEEIYRQAQEDLKFQQQLEAEQKAAEDKQKKAAEKKKTIEAKPTEKLVRYPAIVLTPTGSGELNLRGGPTTSSVAVTQISDGEEVMVIAETSVCEKNGCWVKINTENNLTGYIKSGYLQKI